MKVPDLDVPSGLEEAFFKVVQFARASLQNRIILRRSSPARRLYSRVGARSLFVKWESIWDSFLQTRKDAWTAYWISLPFSSHLGANGYPGSGYSAFVYLNTPRYHAGLPLLLDPPATNLTIWTTSLNISNFQFRGVAWSDSLGLFVSAGFLSGGSNPGRIYSSPDGINWTLRASGYSGSCDGIAYSPSLGMFIVGSTGNGTIARSTDGINWTNFSLIGFGFSFRGVAWSDSLGLFVVSHGGSNGGRILTSPDGVNWTLVYNSAFIGVGAMSWSYGYGLFLGTNTGIGGTNILTSYDGVNWSVRSTSPGANPGKSCNTPFRFLPLIIACAGSTDSQILSTDGVNFSPVNNPLFAQFDLPFWSTRLNAFLGFGVISGTRRTLISYDGVNWSNLASGTSFIPDSIAYSASLDRLVLAVDNLLQYANFID